ncbi:uroporphyrinogen-III synthase [Duganella sp. CF458]|uniref:uroporphyrinogen-III synthase n=1 Tax=Duganella sp. CF458 TaxID=1884368 RepID=UPI0008E2EBAE|nr:uroporphyrinogen-III synthase [Duganella sp. CF458]SFF84687.1 uroporphyrinogen-III synthase [Duganella sp. CF458]
MPRRVILTRPIAQAEPLAGRIRALGREVEVLPLLEISPLPDQAPLRDALAGLTSYQLVAFVSPNAIEAAFGHIPAWPPGLQAAVVGEASRQALLAQGIPASHIASPADPAHSDTEHLLQALDLPALRGARVLIVRGESGRELMADAFRAAGAEVTVLPAYRRAVPQLTPALAERLTALAAAPADWIVTSSEALRGLVGLLNALNTSTIVALLQHHHLIVPHSRIAETARDLGFLHVTLTGSGDERVLAALQSRP